MRYLLLLIFACNNLDEKSSIDVRDADQDGAIDKEDCDDNNPAVYPSASEL